MAIRSVDIMFDRINVVVNGKRDLVKVVANLKKIFESGDRVLLYTFSGEGVVKKVLAESLGVDESFVSENMTYAKFNAYGKLGITKKTAKRFTVFAMPNNLFRKIPCAFNAALKFVDDTDVARFVHFFCDDLKFKAPDKYDPSRYEWYMNTFNCPFLADPKTNKLNFSFKKLSPRFIIVSKKLKVPLSFYHFEGKDHFVFDRERLKENFDEKIDRLYMTEFLLRLVRIGISNHTTFYPDPFLETLLERDGDLSRTQGTDEIRKQLQDDDKYIFETLKYEIVPESAVDPIIEEHGRVIDTLPMPEVEK